MHVSDAAGSNAFQQQAWDAEEPPGNHTSSWVQQEATVQQEHRASHIKKLQHQADAKLLQSPQAVNTDQLQAVHAAYIAALQSGKQQQHSTAAQSDSVRHQQRQQRQQQQPLHVHSQQKQQLPTVNQHALQQLMPPPQRQQHQQQQQKQQACQQLLEQQRALAAYQAALGRPAVQPTAKSLQGRAQQQTHAQGLNPALQLHHAQGVSRQELPAQPPQQVQEGCRKLHGSVALPCNAAQAQNVYKAFQWQKDAIEHADACNRSAAGMDPTSEGCQCLLSPPSDLTNPNSDTECCLAKCNIGANRAQLLM